MYYSITNEQVNNIINRYVENYNGEFWMIEGCLNDNYIITAPGKKTYIIKEVYLNDWCSDMSVRRYNKMPQKYAKIITLLESGETEEAERLFCA